MQGVADYAIFMLDPGGHVSNWNLGAQRIKGYAPGEIIGRHFSQFYDEADRVAFGSGQRAPAFTQRVRASISGSPIFRFGGIWSESS